MLKIKKGIDILSTIGDVFSIEDAIKIFKAKMNNTNFIKIKKISNNEILMKIANAIAMCNPDKVFINDGSKKDRKFIKDLSIQKGEEIALSTKNHTVHYDLKDEQGRIMDRTFYIANKNEEINSLANKKVRKEALKDIKNKMTGIMQGHTMIVGFYIRGPIGAKMSNPAIEITSSAYVSHSADILYRNIFSKFNQEVNRLGHFFTNIHSEGLNRAEDLKNARVYMDRSYQTTYSVNCTYAGNTLMMKKGNHRFAVDKAIYQNKGNEISEHMFITGIDGPNNRVTWFAGAAPSGCGKTTTSMIGTHFVGDDLAQMWIDEKGFIRSINPEKGIFGILKNVNKESDPILMNILRKSNIEVIWSNVLIDKNKIPHWSGNGEKTPLKGYNFQGKWKKGMTRNGKKIPISHPNARCTISSDALSNYSNRTEDPKGVITKIITYSGRDSDTMPPVWVAIDTNHGVVIGASIVSATTATEIGDVNIIKHAPWANAPFIPGSLGDYMNAQFAFFGNKKITNKPIMAGLNYFLTHKARSGKSEKLLGEKKDVKVWLGWLERLAHNEVDKIKTPIGYIPKFEDLKKLFKSEINKEYTKKLYEKQFSIYTENIIKRTNFLIKAYKKEKNIPQKFFRILEKQKKELIKIKNLYGSIITPDKIIIS